MKKLEWVDLESYPGFKLDIRYASTDNFIREKVYPISKAFLLKHVADDLYKAHLAINKHGFGLLIFDGYRPLSVTQVFWDRSSLHDRQFLADPAVGSSHNRGCAVDLSMYHLASGKPVAMPSDFDEMNEKAAADYTGGTAEKRLNRDILKVAMLANHFSGIKNEWWHFNHNSHREWPVNNFNLEEILQVLQIQRPSHLE